MKNPKILLVDDDRNFLLSLSEGLNSYDSQYKILIAGNGREAVDKLNSEEISIVITDLRMPVMDGFELLAFINKNFQNLSVIVMTAFGTSEIEKNLKKYNNCQYIEKPIDFKDLVSKIEKGLSSLSRGFLKGISLVSFIQLVGMEKKNCTLQVSSKGKTGKLYFGEGELFDAETEEIKGLDAAFKIISWESPSIEIKDRNKVKENNINKPLDLLILEAMKRKDESRKDESGKKEPPKKSSKTTKESKMNIKKLNEAIEKVKDDLGSAVITMDVWGVSDAQSLAGYNSHPKAVALFNQISLDINKALDRSGFPTLADFYTLNLLENKLIIIVLLGKYQWGLLLDKSKTNLGMLNNVIIPEMYDLFEEAITE
ncbi:MAG: response regulator [Acidobacteriota bacterium]